MAISLTNMCGKDCAQCQNVKVLVSGAGFYLGKTDKHGAPFCRASEQYYGTLEQAEAWMYVLSKIQGDYWKTHSINKFYESCMNKAEVQKPAPGILVRISAWVRRIVWKQQNINSTLQIIQDGSDYKTVLPMDSLRRHNNV